MGSECLCVVQVFKNPLKCTKESLLTRKSNGCGLDIGVKGGKVVGVRGRATDRVNKGRLGPKGLTGCVPPFSVNMVEITQLIFGGTAGKHCTARTASLSP